MRRLPLILPALLTAGLLAVPGASGAPAVLVLDDPITDNYKASYNADPSVPELRTWLSVRSIAVDGTTWKPVEPAQIAFTPAGTVALVGADGRQGSLRVSAAGGPLGSPIVRIDPTTVESGGRWGPLLSLTNRAALRSSPGLLRLELTTGGAIVGVGDVSYRYDRPFATAAASHIEHNGPGGRWWVGSAVTRTNWEPTPSAPASMPAAVGRPRITRVQLPLRTSEQAVTLRVQGRNAGGVRITGLRVRIGSRPWGSWIPTSSSYTLRLGAGSRTHVVRIQLRDAAGRTSVAAVRRIACTC